VNPRSQDYRSPKIHKRKLPVTGEEQILALPQIKVENPMTMHFLDHAAHLPRYPSWILLKAIEVESTPSKP
jgi:hypothetical protein